MVARLLRLPVVLFALAATLAAIAQAYVPLTLLIPSFAIGMAIGAVLTIAAFAIAGAAMAEMQRHRTTIEPGQRPTSLVTGSIFTRTRNPIYVSLLLITVGLGAMVDSLWFVIAAAALWLTLDRVVVRAEERVLREVFGEEYVAYMRRVRRWL